MKQKASETLMSIISLLLAFSILFSISTYAYEYTDIDKANEKEYNGNEVISISENIYDKTVPSIMVNRVQPEAKWDIVKVRFPFILVPMHSEATYLKNIQSFQWIETKVKVLKYSEDFTYVEVVKTREKGYILSAFLDDDTKGELEIKPGSGRAWVGNEIEITVKNAGSEDIEWSFSEKDMVTYTESSNRIKLKALEAGVLTVTASTGTRSDSYEIVFINRWEEGEFSKTEKEIEVKEKPSSSSKTVKTLPSGSLMDALGDMGIGSEWIFINTEDNKRGFIKLSDFPGIDYIMHQYHYYDEGYDIRFGSASERIYYYAAVLNDAMLRQFNLKVCPYVYPYTSVADECKISMFGSVTAETLAASCPQTGDHKSDSCLKRTVFYNDLKGHVGKGSFCVSKLGWTGHILLDNARSASWLESKIIVITPYKVIYLNYNNQSDYEIRKEQSATLMHETIHQFGINDHYCYEDCVEDEGCSNEGCYKCYGDGHKPNCIMRETEFKSPIETDDLLCDSCQQQILEFLSQQ